jgi:hypothetical protein
MAKAPTDAGRSIMRFSRFFGRCFILILFFFPLCEIEAQRSFDELLPGFGESRKSELYSEGGLIRTLKKNERPEFIPLPEAGFDLIGVVMKTKPSYIAESLLVIPYGEKKLTRLDAYNALGKVRDLKGRLYHSFTRDAEVALFEDATRIEGPHKNTSLPDPPPAAELPALDTRETVFLRLKDINFGNSYYRGELSLSQHGVSYQLTNFRNLSYLLFTVMKEEKFTAVLYMEPLAEGMLIYSVAGADASDFIAGKVHIPSAISKRLAVFIAWLSDGLKATP